MKTKIITLLVVLSAMVATPWKALAAWQLDELHTFTGSNIALDKQLHDVDWDTAEVWPSTPLDGNGRRFIFFATANTATVALHLNDDTWIGGPGVTIAPESNGSSFKSSSAHRDDVKIRLVGLTPGKRYFADVYCDNTYWYLYILIIDDIYIARCSATDAELLGHLQYNYDSDSYKLLEGTVALEAGDKVIFTHTNPKLWHTAPGIADWAAIRVWRFSPSSQSEVNAPVLGSPISFRKSVGSWRITHPGNYHFDINSNITAADIRPDLYFTGFSHWDIRNCTPFDFDRASGLYYARADASDASTFRVTTTPAANGKWSEFNHGSLAASPDDVIFNLDNNEWTGISAANGTLAVSRPDICRIAVSVDLKQIKAGIALPYSPVPEAMQLLQLTDTGVGLLGATAAQFDLDTPLMMTYIGEEVSSTPMILQQAAVGLTAAYVDTATYADIIADPDNFVWTADYLVKALDMADFSAFIAGQQAHGDIVQATMPGPVVKVYNTSADFDGSIDTLTSVAATLTAVSGSDDRFYSAIIDRDGLLDIGKIFATVSYDVDDYSRTATGATLIRPVAPKPYGADISYEYNRYEKPLIDDPENAWTAVTIPASDTINGEEAIVHIATADITPHYYNALLSFKRPNVADAILGRYDIHYTVTLRKSDGSELTFIDPDGDERPINGVAFYDDKTSAYSAKGYTFTIRNVNPDPEIYPILDITATNYIAADGSGSVAATFGDDISVGERNVLLETQSALFSNVRFGVFDFGTGSYDWLYQGHTGFYCSEVDTTGDGHANTEAGYYFLETYIKDDAGNIESWTDRFGNTRYNYAAYPYLVKHIAGHRDEGDEAVDHLGCYINDSDPLIGAIIAKDFHSWHYHPTTGARVPNAITVRFTPVYIFNHDVNLEIDGVISDLMPSDAPFSCVAATRAPRRHAISTTSHTGSSHADTAFDIDQLPDLAEVGEGESFLAIKTFKTSTPFTTNTDKEGVVTSVGSIGIDPAVPDGEEVWYNLQGVRIDKPDHGVTIRAIGGKAEKVVIP